MMRTFFALEHVDLGFNPKNVLVARVVFSNGTYTTPVQKQVFFRQILPRINAIPGVIAASESVRPPADGGITSTVSVPGRAHSDTWISEMELVSEGYFQTIGLPLLRGNLLSATDVDSARKVVVINRKLAHDFFGDEDPIGRTIKFNLLDTLTDAPHDASFEILGIVGDASNLSLQQPPSPEAFMPYTIIGLASRTLLVRTAVDPLSELPNLRREVANVDHSVALSDTGSLESVLHRDFMAAPEFGLVLLAVFAAIGLILSAIGVFSVMSYSVSLQTHDIGIRMALGAQPRAVMKMVLLKGLQPILTGVVVGLISSFGLTHLMASQIYGVSPTDPWTFAAVVVILAVVGMVACLLPARRATRVDPLVALRHE
jgi:putative ABC transport system permease protein